MNLDKTPLNTAIEELEKSFDFIHGGFGRAPKFPLPTHLNFLLRNAQAKMVEFSLTRMAQGGLQDHLGGGFFRYCIDSNWMIPHFEKMLYDNAQLIGVYAQLGLLKGIPLFKDTALAILEWALREMYSPEGGFYSSLNADSEGVEGKYYFWDRDEVRQILTHLEYTAIADYFGLSKPPNFEGHWHLYIADQDHAIYSQGLVSAKNKLLKARNHRVRPSLDKKILTSWNALLIKAMSIAAAVLQQKDFMEAAESTLNFIKQHLWVNNRLLAVYADHQAYSQGLLDDYAFLLEALLKFLQLRWRNDLWQWAIELAEQLLNYFYDVDQGGFYYTPSDHEKLIQRPKIFNDEATPSANGVIVQCLLRCGHWLADTRYLQAAERTLQAAWAQIKLHPSEHDSLLMGLQDYFHVPVVIILRGDSVLLSQWQEEFFRYYLPDHDCFAIANEIELENLPPAFQKPLAEKDSVNAYICQGAVCRETIDNFQAFSDYLRQFKLSIQA